MNILKIFKRKNPNVITDTIIQSYDSKKFTCHYCQHQFEVTDKMQFPISVPSVGKEYTFQGIGVTCPKCLKDSIFG